MRLAVAIALTIMAILAAGSARSDPAIPIPLPATMPTDGNGA